MGWLPRHLEGYFVLQSRTLRGMSRFNLLESGTPELDIVQLPELEEHPPTVNRS
jgi:hypothetical protein